MKRVWTGVRFNRLESEWLNIIEKTQVSSVNMSRTRILLIPPDPLLLTASRGDEAMIISITTYCKKIFSDPELVIAVVDEKTDHLVRSLGAEPCPALNGKFSLKNTIELLLEKKITHCITIGADVCDGSYDPVFSARLIMIADLMARNGIKSIVNGFSFSEKANPLMKKIFDNTAESVKFNLRDPVSYSRFKKFSTAGAQLTSDVAFLLKPEARENEKIEHLKVWIKSQKDNRAAVIGFNVHPLLLDLNDRSMLPTLISEVGFALKEIIEKDRVSLVLLEHDFRGTSADSICFDPLEDFLRVHKCLNHVYRATKPLSAAEIKAAVGNLDGVVSGRMHLAIASLGMGVPIMAIGYKGKMEGLLKHFNLDKRLLVSGVLLVDKKSLLVSFRYFLNNIADIRREVRENLEKVKTLAEKNLSSFAN